MKYAFLLSRVLLVFPVATAMAAGNHTAKGLSVWILLVIGLIIDLSGKVIGIVQVWSVKTKDPIHR